MPIMNLPSLPGKGAKMEDVIDHVAMLQKAVDFLMSGNLNSDNAFEFGGWRITKKQLAHKSGLIGFNTEDTGAPDDIRIWAGGQIDENPLYQVRENGLIKILDADGNVRIEMGPYETDHYGIRLSSPKNTNLVLNEYGFNPSFIKRYKNLVWNSSFERYDRTSLHPLYWDDIGGAVEVTDDAAFFGSHSLRIPPSNGISQSKTAVVEGSTAPVWTNPDWYGREVTRVTLYKKFGPLIVNIRGGPASTTLPWDSSIDILDVTLPDGTVNTGSYNIPANADWEQFTFSFDPGTYERIWIQFYNNDPTDDVYIDSVQMEPDFTGMWPSFYTDGPRSSEMDFDEIYDKMDDIKDKLNDLITKFNAHTHSVSFSSHTHSIPTGSTGSGGGGSSTSGTTSTPETTLF